MPGGRNKHMAIQGSGLKDKNTRLRFFGFIFLSIIAFGAVLYWRQAALTAAEYVEPPPIRKKTMDNSDALRSANYELEVVETNPSAR